MSTPEPVSTIAQLLRPGSAPRTSDVSAADREHAATVVSHLLHEQCQEWSWTQHHPETHRAEARRIVGALCREGWSPRPPEGERGCDHCSDTSGAA